MASGDTLAMFLPGSHEPPSSAYAYQTMRGTHPVLAFAGTVADVETIFTGILPRNYAGGGLTVYCYWATAAATSGSLRCQCDIERMDVGTTDLDADSFTGSFQSAGGTAPGTSGILFSTAVAFTSGAQMDSLAAGEMFRLKIRRDQDGTSGTDDIAEICHFFGCEVKET